MDQQLYRPIHGGGAHQVTGRTVVLGSVAIGGELLCMMGISFVSTMTLLLITCPLVIIFSPLLLFAGFLFLSVFAVAAVMALVGMSTIVGILRSYSGREMFGSEDENICSREQ